jgi:hypothetical protein
MGDGFVNIWVEQRGKRFFAVVETGDGKRTISPPLRTVRAANLRAEKALAVICGMHPEAEVTSGDQKRSTKPSESAPQMEPAADVRHEVGQPEEPQA